MSPSRTSAKAILAVGLLLATPLAGAIAPSLQSVGAIFVDAAGRASGENLATLINERSGHVEGFRSPRLGTTIFSAVDIEGFEAREKIAGIGSPTLTLRGSNAIVTLHDNLHSMMQIRATDPTTVTYRLDPEATATQEGARGSIVRVEHATRGTLGHLVAVGAEGPLGRGETFQIKPNAIIARVQSGSELVFLARTPDAPSPEFESVLVEALAQGALASHHVTEFRDSRIRATDVTWGERAATRTSAQSGAGVETLLVSRASGGSVLAYDLAYETLPASSPQNVAVFVDGALAERAASATELLARAHDGQPGFHALIDAGRVRVLASVPAGGEHRVSVTASANADREQQSRAEERADEDARVYGGFEYHANGKLTGRFLTSVIPEGRATLLRFTALASRTEVFRSVSLDGGAQARFHASGADEFTLTTPAADVTLIDDALASLLISARGSARASFELADGVSAQPISDDILALSGPSGPVGALILVGSAEAKRGASLAVAANGAIDAKLGPGIQLIFRGAPDGHASEAAILRALASGRLGAQLLAGVQASALATRATTYAEGVDVRLAASRSGAIEIGHRTEGDAPRAFVLDARGAALVAKEASDIIVSLDGVALDATPRVEDVLAGIGAPTYHASTSADGALRVIIDAGAAAGTTSTLLIESAVAQSARGQARTDAFGAFRLFHDGTAIGSFVTLRTDRAAGAVTGVTMLATGQPLFASILAGDSPYANAGADGATVLKLENREARLEFSDTTNAYAKIVATKDTRAAFRLATGLTASPGLPGIIDLVDTAGARIGSLVLTGAGTLEARASGEVHATLSTGSTLLFRTHAGIESELSDAQRSMLNAAIAAGHMAGQVTVQTQASLAADARELERTTRTGSEGVALAAARAFGELTSAVSASYGDVVMQTSATKARVDITLSAHGPGRTLVVSLDPDTIPGMSTGKARILFDGQLAAQAASYADILDPTDDGDVAEYFVLAGEAGTQVLVSIPSFSVHTVTLEQTSASGSQPVYLYATVALAIIAVAQGIWLARTKITLNERRP